MSVGRERTWPAWLAWLASLAAVGAAMAVGGAFPPDAWYEQLIKPTWQPPDSVFAPIWSMLYAALAIALALLIQSPRSVERRQAITLFGLQLVFNAAWTVLFFGLHSPLFAFVDVICLWIFALCSALAALAVRPASAWLQLPNLLWVSFALVLNGVIMALNW
jgi:tryptophan-rich sensory protein